MVVMVMVVIVVLLFVGENMTRVTNGIFATSV
jgi:hypothetical protein